MTIYNIKEVQSEELRTTYDLRIIDHSCSLIDIETLLLQCENLRWLLIDHDSINTYPRNLRTLPDLNRLILTLPNLSELKGELLPTTLKYLEINSAKLERIKEADILHLPPLNSLRIEAPIKNLCSIKHLSTLISIVLSKTHLVQLDALPSHLVFLSLSENQLLTTVDVAELKSLTALHLRDNKQRITVLNIGDCLNLNDVSLFNIEKIPVGLEKCINIINLSLGYSPIKTLPDWITDFSQLRNLSINYTYLTTVPENWENLTRLETLNITNCEMEDFSFAFTIPNLYAISFDHNPIKDPLFMLNAAKRLPTFSTRDFFDFKALDIKEIPSFMSALGKSGLSRADREWYFYSFKDLKSIEITSHWSQYRLVQGLSIPYKAVNDRILSYLLKLPQNQVALDTFNSGAVYFLDGTFAEKKNEIKVKLKTLGINIAASLSDEVTHVILGKKPTEAIAYWGEREFPFLTEQQLYQHIRDVGQEDKFLVQEAQSGERQMINNLKQLLASPDANSVHIGLEMLKTGGIPADILEELVLLGKTFNDVKVRAEAKKIVEKQGLPTWLGVLKDKQTFVGIPQTKDKEIRDKLEKMAKSVHKNEVFAFAMLLGKYHQKGFAYILANFPVNSDYRKQALMALTDGTYFDFHKGVGYHNWKDSNPEEVILSQVKTGIAFPSDHPNIKTVKVINMHNCKFDTLSKDIVLFENTEELDLSVNNLRSIPLGLGQMTHLRVLNLSFNRLTSFPASLEKLKNLEILDLRYNSQHAFKSGAETAIKVPNSFTEKLPTCTVLL